MLTEIYWFRGFIHSELQNWYQQPNCRVSREYSAIETTWYTTTRGRGSEGATGEWSGYPAA
jgi:hypothetical protein